VDELEQCFKGFVNEVGKVILNLLCALDIGNGEEELSEPIDSFMVFLVIVLETLDPQVHVPTDPPALLAGVVHMAEHAEYGSFLWTEPHIQQHRKLALDLSAESVKKPVVRGQLTAISVLCDDEQVHLD
jgi:hypothetical protein